MGMVKTSDFHPFLVILGMDGDGIKLALAHDDGVSVATRKRSLEP